MLILDCATMHLVDEYFNTFFKYNINEFYVPKGLTPVSQPLDMTINKLIKDEMKDNIQDGEPACQIILIQK